MFRLTKAPTVLLDDDGDFVTVVRSENANVFVAFDPETLRVRWQQRAPGDANDPHGLRDFVTTDGEWRGRTWRERLAKTDYVALLDRAADANEYAQWEVVS